MTPPETSISKMMVVKSAAVSWAVFRVLQILLLAGLLCNIFIYYNTWQQGASPPPSDQFSTNYVSSIMTTRQILFVGGCPRSGTTLARAMLDAHPDVRCGEETRVLPNMLRLRKMWDGNMEHNRLKEAGLGDNLLDQATVAFMSEILLHHGEPAKFLCNKDPMVLGYMSHVIRLFPKAKFVLMIRDARAVAYSIVSRNVTISGVDHTNYLAAAEFWNKVVTSMLDDCKLFGEKHCMVVFYEKLIRDPKTWMEKILEFGGIPWHDNVLHHHELINKEVFLSK